MRRDRLRRLTAAELCWRGTAAARTAVQDLASRVRPPRWRREDLIAALTRDAADAVRGPAARGDWHAVHDALAARLRERPARFVLDPASAARVRDAILGRWPSAAAAAAAAADRIADGRYDLLGYQGLSFAAGGARVDWHLDPVHGRRAPRVFFARVPFLDPAIGDHKVIWEINRHQHWLRLVRAAWLTGDDRYRAVILDDLAAWLDANPPLVGINWASMLEIGFRTLSWTFALHALLAPPAPTAPPAREPWLVDMLVALDRQLRHVEHHLSYYFSPNTHLTGEALALYVIGTALPELAAASRWARVGRQVLLDEIGRQVLADGGHAERSTHYLRYTLDFYLLALLTARRAGDAEAEARFGDAAHRLASFTRTIADDQGRLPLIGDDDGGMSWPIAGRACHDVRDSLALAAWALARPELAPWGPAEEACWVGGPEAITAAAPVNAGAELAVPGANRARSQTLADTGYVVLRDGRGDHAVVDAGAHGYMNGGHAHADALSLTLTLADRPLLVDPGTSTYIMDAALRDRMRSSASHNTITVDGRPSSLPGGPFHWRTRTDARLLTVRSNEAFDWMEAAHDGYAPLRHHRTVVRTFRSGWLIVDDLIGGDARHAAAAHWHFAPEWTVAHDDGGVQATHRDGTVAFLLHDGQETTLHRGDETLGLGWMAPVYGTLRPIWSARVVTAGNAPLQMLTWVGGGPEWRHPTLSRLHAVSDPALPAVAAQVIDGDRAAVFLLRPGGPMPHAARGCRAAAYETDARLLHYHACGDRLLALDLADAEYATPVRDGWLAIRAEEPVADLHVALGHGLLDLRATVPPPTLHLQVSGTYGAVRLNGREWTARAPHAGGRLLIHASEWHDDAGTPARPLSGATFADH